MNLEFVYTISCHVQADVLASSSIHKVLTRWIFPRMLERLGSQFFLFRNIPAHEMMESHSEIGLVILIPEWRQPFTEGLHGDR